jgi:hypothetical protein
MRPEADINANEVDAASPLKRPSNTSEEENVRDAPDDSKLTVADLSASLPLPKEAPAIHNEEELNERDLDDSMSRPLTNDHVPAIGNLSIKGLLHYSSFKKRKNFKEGCKLRRFFRFGKTYAAEL